MHCSRRLIVHTLVFSLSYLHRQVSPSETLVVKGGTTWARNGLWILPENARLPCNIQGSFTCRKSTTWDKRHYFPSEGRRAEDFFGLKNPTASAGFEPVNLGTKGQHATSRPPKPLPLWVTFNLKTDFFFNCCKHTLPTTNDSQQAWKTATLHFILEQFYVRALWKILLYLTTAGAKNAW